MNTTTAPELKATQKKLNLKKDTLRLLSATPTAQAAAGTWACSGACTATGTSALCC